jgi:hypothetical protein
MGQGKMDSQQSKPTCWEITGCGSQDDCKVWQLVKSSGKPCWEAVASFDDYRSALNVCGDCVVSVLNNAPRPLGRDEIEDIRRVNAENPSRRSCPGLASS